MSKKFLTIFLSLFLLGILSISCSNSDKTSSSTVDNSKGIEQFNDSIYVSSELTIGGNNGYLWISIKDDKVSVTPSDNNTTAPEFMQTSYFDVTGTGSDYSFSANGQSGLFEGTLKFAADASTVTLKLTKNEGDPTGETLNKDFVCNKQ
ncbi:hypothetical protein [Brachyspira pilosicoli]|uniref:hypothetical protein n=1 Tax=Brachyspira pilosicoli TaxID=52584 RepID=UPI0030074CE6